MTTYAPQRLLEVRRYLKALTGLSDNELGIVGDASHHGGYHHGWDMRRIVNGVTADYSWTESLRDSSHKTEAASAIDIGNFPRLREFSLWLVNECVNGAQDTLDIRSVIYSPDGQTVERWDRMGYRTSGDSSHLTHTHVSYFRDAEDRSKVGLYQRFFGGTVMDDYGNYGTPPDIGDRKIAVEVADLWGQEMNGNSPYDDAKSYRTRQLDLIAEKVSVWQPIPQVDPVVLAQALAAQQGFVETLAESMALKVIEHLKREIAGAN